MRAPATGWDRLWGGEAYAHGSPHLGHEAARHLVEAGAAMVGIDALLIDDPDDPDVRPSRPGHANLLAAGIPIIENMRGLTDLPARPLLVTAVPALIEGVGSFPVRAFARELPATASLS